MIVDFSTASVQVQAHWEPIADATYNLHRPTQEQFDKLKARLSEPVNMEWEQVLKLFNPKPAHPLKNYSQTDFEVFSRLQLLMWEIFGNLTRKEFFLSSASFTRGQQQRSPSFLTGHLSLTGRKRVYGRFRPITPRLSSEFMRSSCWTHPVFVCCQRSLQDDWC